MGDNKKPSYWLYKSFSALFTVHKKINNFSIKKNENGTKFCLINIYSNKSYNFLHVCNQTSLPTTYTRCIVGYPFQSVETSNELYIEHHIFHFPYLINHNKRLRKTFKFKTRGKLIMRQTFLNLLKRIIALKTAKSTFWNFNIALWTDWVSQNRNCLFYETQSFHWFVSHDIMLVLP